jgi:uroporphyrinogen decarboxylase
MYAEFSVPYMKRLMDAIHEEGMKAILIYFGGIADRVDQIVSLGADALQMETSMKGYINDLASIAAQVNNRMLLFGNIDPIGIVEQSSDAQLETVLMEQIHIGKKAVPHNLLLT